MTPSGVAMTRRADRLRELVGRAGNAGRLASGAAVGQAASIAALPVLARVYGAAEIGTFAVLLSFGNFLTLLSTCRFEYALPKEARPASRRALAQGITAMAVLSAPVLAGVTVLLGGDAGLGYLHAGVLIALLTAANSLSGIANLGGLAARRIPRLATSRAVAGFVLAGTQISFGLIQPSVEAFVAGYVLYTLTPVALLGLWPALGEKERPRRPMALLHRHRALMQFTMPGALCSNASLALPVIGLSALFGEAAAGTYFLARRFIIAPTQLLAVAVADDFYSAAARKDRAELDRSVRRRLRALAIAGAGLAAVLLVASPLIGFLAGPSWPDLALYILILIPVAVGQLIVTPLENAFLVLDKDWIRLIWNLGRLLAFLAVFGFAWGTGLSMMKTISLLSFTTAVSYSVIGIVLLRTLRAGRPVNLEEIHPE